MLRFNFVITDEQHKVLLDRCNRLLDKPVKELPAGLYRMAEDLATVGRATLEFDGGVKVPVGINDITPTGIEFCMGDFFQDRRTSKEAREANRHLMYEFICELTLGMNPAHTPSDLVKDTEKLFPGIREIPEHFERLIEVFDQIEKNSTDPKWAESIQSGKHPVKFAVSVKTDGYREIKKGAVVVGDEVMWAEKIQTDRAGVAGSRFVDCVVTEVTADSSGAPKSCTLEVKSSGQDKPLPRGETIKRTAKALSKCSVMRSEWVNENERAALMKRTYDRSMEMRR